MNEKFTGIPLVQDKEVEMLAHQSMYGIWFVLKRSSALLKCLLYYYPELKPEKILIERLIEDIDQMLGKENKPDKPE